MRFTSPMPPPCLTIVIPGHPTHSRTPSSTGAPFNIPTYSHRIPPATRRPRPLVLATTSALAGVTQKSPVRSVSHAHSPEWWVGEGSADEVARARVRGPRAMPQGGGEEVRRTAGIWSGGEEQSPAHSSYHSPSPSSAGGSAPVSPVEVLAERAVTAVVTFEPSLPSIPSPPYSHHPATHDPRPTAISANPFIRSYPIKSTTTLPLYASTDDLFARPPPPRPRPHHLNPAHHATLEPTVGRPESAAQRVLRAGACPWEALSPKSPVRGKGQDEVRLDVRAWYAEEKTAKRRVAVAAAVRKGLAERRGLLVGIVVGLVVLLSVGDLIWVNVELVKLKRAGW